MLSNIFLADFIKMKLHVQTLILKWLLESLEAFVT